MTWQIYLHILCEQILVDFENCGRYGIATYGTIFGRDDIATNVTGW